MELNLESKQSPLSRKCRRDQFSSSHQQKIVLGPRRKMRQLTCRTKPLHKTILREHTVLNLSEPNMSNPCSGTPFEMTAVPGRQTNKSRNPALKAFPESCRLSNIETTWIVNSPPAGASPQTRNACRLKYCKVETTNKPLQVFDMKVIPNQIRHPGHKECQILRRDNRGATNKSPPPIA